jgi:hypothetical protein
MEELMAMLIPIRITGKNGEDIPANVWVLSYDGYLMYLKKHRNLRDEKEERRRI